MIGYYVHHHGAGHITRARQVARHLQSPVTGFSSLPRPDAWPGAWVELPHDVSEAPIDPTAGGVLHWAPLHHDGYAERMAALSTAMRGLDLMVVDVSVEVSLLARLHGVPTVVLAMRGDRRDRAHLLAYDSATALLAPWPRALPERWWPAPWTQKTRFVGAISRFDERPPLPGTAAGATRRALVLMGAGGHEMPADALASAARHTPGWEWTLRSAESPSPDLWADLGGAHVVVSHGGNNAVAEVAAARRPAVVVAQQRPFAEQHHTVSALERAGICVGLQHWPAAERWPAILDEAIARGSSGWAHWNPLDGARRAAQYLDDLAATGGT